MGLRSGDQIAQFSIVGEVGAGGMGVVYQARDTKLDRDVAIKVLPDAFAQDEQRLSRFRREAKTLAGLNHPNIATVYDFLEEDDTKFLVMELVEGDTLEDRITRGALSVKEALPLFVQIAEGLDAAHEQGIIHRGLVDTGV